MFNKIKRSKKGFKVCHIWFDGKLRSALNLGKTVDYKKRKWTKRPEGCGPLAVFNTTKNAIQFVRHNINSKPCIIFKCKYKKSYDEILWIPSLIYIGDKKKFIRIPRGTRFADKLKIKRRMIYVGKIKYLS